ncbi:MAG: hypothetical protein ACI89X_004288 [Planctomycetota bacterium]|jgi:hypothetical protein
MTHHGRAFFVFCLLVCTAALTGGCSSADYVLPEERTHEVAVLRQQLAEKDRHLDYLASEVQRLEQAGEQKRLMARAEAARMHALLPVPDLAGKVIRVSGKLCVVVVDKNPDNVDIKKAIAQMPLRFAIYDENGFKAEAVGTKYLAGANTVLGRMIFTKGETTIVIGDKVCTKP